MGADEDYSIISKYKFYIIIQEIKDIIKNKPNFYLKEIAHKLYSFFVSEDFKFWMHVQKDNIFTLIFGNLELIEKNLSFKILFPLLEELKNTNFEINIKTPNQQLKVIMIENDQNYYKKYKKEKKEEHKEIISIVKKNKFSTVDLYPRNYSCSLEGRLFEIIFIFSIMKLFVNKEKMLKIKILELKDCDREFNIYNYEKISFASAIAKLLRYAITGPKNAINEILSYYINLEISNNLEFENLKQFIIMFIQIINLDKKVLDYSKIFSKLFSLNNIDLKDNYLFLSIKQGKLPTINTFSLQKKNDNKNPSINIFEFYKKERMINYGKNIYQSFYKNLFNNKVIISLNNISEKYIEENKITIEKEFIDKFYIELNNKIITLQEFNDLYLKIVFITNKK